MGHKNADNSSFPVLMWTLLDFFGCAIGGAKRDRTADLLVANEALSQLSYSPTMMGTTSISLKHFAINVMSDGPRGR
jgi:hypothetical protein